MAAPLIIDALEPGEEIVRRRRGAVEWIIFNRPGARNAITHRMEASLTTIFRELNADADVRAVVLTGAAGTKPAFMAGADMGDLQNAASPESAMRMEERSEQMLISLEEVRAPVIAAMAGACVGQGALIASACDVRLGCSSLRFGFAALIKRLQQDNERKQSLIERQTREIAWRDAKLEKVTFELARLKRWKFGASTEAMGAQQRALFEETMAEDEASLQAQLAALKASLPDTPDKPKAPPRKPRRQHLPEHLRRVEHRHEPQSTECGCGTAMVRVGEDVSERLDIIPAEFFVHRHIYGKWACRCCQKLVQAAAVPELIDGGIAASGFVAHTLISRFVDHMPYYRQETINARSGVHTPRSTLASISGQAGAALEPLHEALKQFVLQAPVLHADETPVAMLDPGSGKTKRAYVWAYARGEFDSQRGVVFDFCLGRGAQYPTLFLAGGSGPPGREQPPWRGTLLTDQYAVYDAVVHERTCSGRIAAACVAHARRKFEELANTGASDVAQEAIRRFALIYHAEGQFAGLDERQRLAARQELTRPMWDNLFEWLQLERRRVADGGATAKAIDYSLGCWRALTRHLHHGAVGLDNNYLERQIKPWQMGRNKVKSAFMRSMSGGWPRRSRVLADWRSRVRFGLRIKLAYLLMRHCHNRRSTWMSSMSWTRRSRTDCVTV